MSDKTLHPGAKASRYRHLMAVLAGLLLVSALGIGGFVCLTLTSPSPELPSFATVRGEHAMSEAVLLDRHHEVIHEMRVDPQGRRLDWVPLDEVSPAMQAAILNAEDQRFYDHAGVDWTSMASALRGVVSSASLRGASTITMQLVSKLDRQLEPGGGRRSLGQKVRQIRAAKALEKRWSKAEILEAYLNLVSYRGELQGISAATAGLFGKRPHGLDHSESLILAALVRSPNAGADQVTLRALRLAGTMGLPLDRADILTRIRDTFSRPYFVQPQASLAPHVAAQLLQSAKARTGREPDKVVSTLDGRIQLFAAETLRRHLQSVRPQNVHDGAVLVAANETGEVLAYVGNDGNRSSARHVDGIRAQRQAGSTLKPFIYGLAFDQRLLTPVSLIEDGPLDVPVVGGIYRPKNYDKRFHGLVTARTALASSLNVPAVKILNFVGVELCVNRLRLFGFQNLRSAEFYGPSLALGSADVTLWDLVNAYRTLAAGGVCTPLRLYFHDAAGFTRRALSPEASFLVADILSDRESRSLTFSLESPLATRFWTAVKTGTSKDMRDNWCVGFSNQYTVGVWTGNFSGEPMWDVSGVTGAAPVWVEIMNWLHREHPGTLPAPPRGLTARKVALPGFGQSRREWFISGTETTTVLEAANQAAVRIAYPAPGTIIALDPDIPPEQQRLFFEAQSDGTPLRWILDGQDIGDAAAVLLWPPTPGKHSLSLVGDGGRTCDTVAFEVRGHSADTR